MEGGLAVTGLESVRSDQADFVRCADAAVDDAYRLAGYLLGGAADAEDAVQDALIKAWQGWSGLRDPSRFRAWFDRILVNVCHDRMRRHRTLRMVELEAADGPETTDPFRELGLEDEVGAAVAHLVPEQRVVIALRYWRDLTLEDVAAVLDLPVGTVKSRIHYALRDLRVELVAARDEA